MLLTSHWEGVNIGAILTPPDTIQAAAQAYQRACCDEDVAWWELRQDPEDESAAERWGAAFTEMRRAYSELVRLLDAE